jgi:hypothetical protein
MPPVGQGRPALDPLGPQGLLAAVGVGREPVRVVGAYKGRARANWRRWAVQRAVCARALAAPSATRSSLVIIRGQFHILALHSPPPLGRQQVRQARSRPHLQPGRNLASFIGPTARRHAGSPGQRLIKIPGGPWFGTGPSAFSSERRVTAAPPASGPGASGHPLGTAGRAAARPGVGASAAAPYLRGARTLRRAAPAQRGAHAVGVWVGGSSPPTANHQISSIQGSWYTAGTKPSGEPPLLERGPLPATPARLRAEPARLNPFPLAREVERRSDCGVASAHDLKRPCKSVRETPPTHATREARTSGDTSWLPSVPCGDLGNRTFGATKPPPSRLPVTVTFGALRRMPDNG